MSDWDKKADEEIVIYHIMRRDRLAAHDRLTPRMEARQIIDALDIGRQPHSCDAGEDPGEDGCCGENRTMSDQTIYKFDLAIADKQRIAMPCDARVLSVAAQHGRPVLWALVSPDAEYRDRVILMRGTGHQAAGVEFAVFIGTVLLAGDSLIFHVFEARP